MTAERITVDEIAAIRRDAARDVLVEQLTAERDALQGVIDRFISELDDVRNELARLTAIVRGDEPLAPPRTVN